MDGEKQQCGVDASRSLHDNDDDDDATTGLI